MRTRELLRARASRAAGVGLAVTAAMSIAAGSVLANVAVTQLSTDPYTNTTSQHRTEVEPDSFSFGSTIVAVTQVGRFNNGGSSNIGWATSTDGGATWPASGFLSGITVFGSPAGPYDRATDPAVAFDAAHNVWMISTLGLSGTSSVVGAAVLTSRSTDGGLTWGNPVTVAAASGTQNFDKNWIACDNTATSPFYGHCYTEFDDNGAGDLIHMSTSTDGGLTWGPALNTANNATGLGGQPLVQPNGTVVVPIANAFESAILSFVSTNGGASWGSTVTVSKVRVHTVAGNLRTGPLPSAEIDAAGTVYVAWQDCRFRRGCKANDIVLSTSTNGTSWSSVVRVPIDSTNSGVDHFLPGLGVDRATSGASAHLGLAYYFYPVANCTSSTCQLDIGFVSSSNGGSSWTGATQIAGPMNLSWLPSTTQGVMVGDYMSTSFSGGTAHPLIIIANAPSGGLFDEALYTPTAGLSAAAVGANRAGLDRAVAASSDHAAAQSALTQR